MLHPSLIKFLMLWTINLKVLQVKRQMLRVCQLPAMQFFVIEMDFTRVNGHQWSRSLFEKNIEEDCVFLHFEDILVRTFPGINALSVEEEFIIVVSHAIRHFNTQIHPLFALWQYLFGICGSKSWLNIFGLIEICMCAPCSNAKLETFFSQLHVVKSVWCNRLSEENLMHLL